jgi:uncharacterized membrane protein
MIRRDVLREYASGSLWVWPSLAALLALAAGWSMSLIRVPAGSVFSPLAFSGTSDDARNLLTTITGTVVTVIALVLGLTVVALQLSSTQFSPRLLRNFIRDRPNQVALSVFVATFAYSAAGLYTVGSTVKSGTQDFPRLAVSGAIVLMFASLAMVVFFADHLMHSIQIDAITKRVEQATLGVVAHRLGSVENSPPVPDRAVPVPAIHSGYVQVVHPAKLLPLASRDCTYLRLCKRVGEHVVAGTPLAWIWHADPQGPTPDPALFGRAVDRAIQIGFERTLEQDAAFGIRQLVDVACKALSPAVNDPYTAIQSIDHLSVIFCALARRPLGDYMVRDLEQRAAVIIPGRRFGDYLATMCGLIRRYGATEPTVSVALIRLLANCAAVVEDDLVRWQAIAEQADLIVADATREVAQPRDLGGVQAAAQSLQQTLHRHLGPSATQPCGDPQHLPHDE